MDLVCEVVGLMQLWFQLVAPSWGPPLQAGEAQDLHLVNHRAGVRVGVQGEGVQAGVPLQADPPAQWAEDPHQ